MKNRLRQASHMYRYDESKKVAALNYIAAVQNKDNWGCKRKAIVSSILGSPGLIRRCFQIISFILGTFPGLSEIDILHFFCEDSLRNEFFKLHSSHTWTQNHSLAFLDYFFQKYYGKWETISPNILINQLQKMNDT